MSADKRTLAGLGGPLQPSRRLHSARLLVHALSQNWVEHGVIVQAKESCAFGARHARRRPRATGLRRWQRGWLGLDFVARRILAVGALACHEAGGREACLVHCPLMCGPARTRERHYGSVGQRRAGSRGVPRRQARPQPFRFHVVRRKNNPRSRGIQISCAPQADAAGHAQDATMIARDEKDQSRRHC